MSNWVAYPEYIYNRTSVKPGGNTMYPVLNIHSLRILSTRYIRVILTTNSIISK